MSKYARPFVPGNYFQPNPTFASEVRASWGATTLSMTAFSIMAQYNDTIMQLTKLDAGYCFSDCRHAEG
jgi:hypothetical protein